MSQKINDILTQACEGVATKAVKKPWYFWLATADFLSAEPYLRRDDGSERYSTEAPVVEFTTPYLGQDVDTLAKKLRDAPEEAYLNRVFFAVADERTIDDGSIMLCNADKADEGVVDWLRARPKRATLHFQGFRAGAGSWGELKDSWEFHKRVDGVDVAE